MRISTPMMYDQGVKNIQERQNQLVHLQDQLSSGKAILNPSDDPVANARILDLQQTAATTTQYSKNSDSASSALSFMETAIGNAVETLQNVKTAAVQGGNATLNAADRETMAQQIDQAFQQLMSTANTTNSEGEYIFSGYSANTKPFSETATGQVSYAGDQGVRSLQISSSLQLPVSQNGFNVFQQIPAGNGVFLTSTSSTNKGSGTIDTGSVTNPGSLTGDQYAISFAVTTPSSGGSPVTTYSVVDTTKNAVVLSNQTYQPDTAIQFDGLSVTVKGAPANTDQFTIQPTTNQSVFTTLDQLRQALRAPQTNDTEKAAFQSKFSTALAGVDQALSHVVNAQAAVGAYIKQADASKTMADDLSVQYQNQLSQLNDLDYAKAISDYSQQQVFLQAAQKTFVQMQGLSLFNFIS
jgi:flagellar hook-associated protein 3 FlgL